LVFRAIDFYPWLPLPLAGCYLIIIVGAVVGFAVAIPMGSATEANCDATTSSWWLVFLINVGVADGFTVANPIGDAIEDNLGTIALSVDSLLALPMGSPSLSPWVMLPKHKTMLQQ
jgi:hypothetical protein